MRIKALILMTTLWAALNAEAVQNSVREKQNFDFDWVFTLSDNEAYSLSNFDDGAWEAVQLPHDWNIKQDFVSNGDGSAAYLPEGIGWYRKNFALPKAWKGKKVTIRFDGICMQSDVYINGHHLGFRPYGFGEIVYDLTLYLNKEGENVIAVRVDTTNGRPRWYSGAGIYRHAWLEATNHISVANHGIYITTPQVSSDEATVRIASTVDNETSKDALVSIEYKVLAPDGAVVAKYTSKQEAISAGKSGEIEAQIYVADPLLWSVDTPNLYTLEARVKSGGKIVDNLSETFGIRTFSFDSEHGFSLNGKPMKLKGLCLHQDAGGLGVAVPDRAYERRLEILKEYGCNALRMAHNQPSPELLDMCDRMGFVVIDEALDKWKSGYYEKYFDEWWQHDMDNMILRDRNHPCIILWSIGNEVTEAWDGTGEGVKRAQMLNDYVHQLDPTRPTTMAAQNRHNADIGGVTDVIGYNYLEARMLSDHKRYPERCFVVSEELPYYSGEEGNIRSYTPYNPWNIVAANDFIAGGFIWSGVDYLGEAGWPSKGWPNGLFDINMHEKPRAAYHRAMWNPEPMVRIAVYDPSLDIDHGRDLWQWPNIADHWNFPGSYYGLMMDIHTTTNCDEVELYCNGNKMGRMATADFPNNTIVWHIPYDPGKLEATGYIGGEEKARYMIQTSGKATSLLVTPDVATIKADGQDMSHIALQLIDDNGIPVQTDDRKVTASIRGEGRIVAFDSGDLRVDKSFHSDTLRTYQGRALLRVQSTRNPGSIEVLISVEGHPEPYIVNITK